MGIASSKLFQLRPVTFFYSPQHDDSKQLQDNGGRLLQYGLIAEEVAKVSPELVSYNKDGQPYSVKYQNLLPMLLNEVQKQATEIRDLKQQVAELNDLKQEMRAALLKLQNKDELVAQR